MLNLHPEKFFKKKKHFLIHVCIVGSVLILVSEVPPQRHVVWGAYSPEKTWFKFYWSLKAHEAFLQTFVIRNVYKTSVPKTWIWKKRKTKRSVLKCTTRWYCIKHLWIKNCSILFTIPKTTSVTLYELWLNKSDTFLVFISS